MYLIMLKKNCLFCGEEFVKPVSNSLKYWDTSRRFCSSICGNTWKRGKYISWNKGTKGLVKTWNKGRLSPETTGENNHRWKGGRCRKYYRAKVLLRDDYTCKECKFRDLEIMQVDHIKPEKFFPELRFDIGNLQTLCPNCHARKTLVLLKQKKK